MIEKSDETVLQYSGRIKKKTQKYFFTPIPYHIPNAHSIFGCVVHINQDESLKS